jgi:DNA mismatch repair ATPase MutS
LATSAEMRRSLVTQKVLAQNSMAMLPILQQAQSSYLRQLGDVLAMALDDSGPLDIAKTQRFLNRVTTNPILSIPLRLIPPLTAVMYHKRNKVKEAVHRMVVIYSVLAEADYLLGFAKLKHSDMNLRFPTILDPDPRADLLEIQEGSLPFMYFGRQQHPHYLRTTPVTNNARISTADDRPGHLLFITGPNGRGKTTYLRMIAQLAIMAQNGLPVPVEFMKLQPMKIYSSMKNTDSTVDGESLFRAEVRRVSEIVRTAREPSKEARLYLFDEVFTGTSYEEKTAAEEAIYKYLVEHRTAAIVTSHNRNLVRLGEEIPGFVNLHASEDPAQAFRILPGPSRTRNALDVMREEGIPAEIIKDAEGILSQLLK